MIDDLVTLHLAEGWFCGTAASEASAAGQETADTHTLSSEPLEKSFVQLAEGTRVCRVLLAAAALDLCRMNNAYKQVKSSLALHFD